MHSARPALQPLELGDLRVDARAPAAREPRPVAAAGRAVGGSVASSAPISSSESPTRWAKTMNAIRRSTGRGIAPVPGSGALGADQAALLVEAQRRGGDAAAPRHLADREQLGHPRNFSIVALDFKLT